MRRVNTINIILRVNQVSYVITWLLFITFWYGFIAEFFLGIIQIISSLLLILYWKHLSNELKRETFLYWILIALYFIGFYLVLEFNLFPESIAAIVVGVVFVPMLIGLYLLLHLSSTKKSFES